MGGGAAHPLGPSRSGMAGRGSGAKSGAPPSKLGGGSRLLSAGLLLPVSVALAIFLYSELTAIKADFDHITQSNQRLLQLTTSALLLDEAITQSMASGAEAGSPSQKVKHEELSSRLEKAVTEAKELAPKLVEPFLVTTKTQERRIQAFESQAWSLIIGGRAAEARSLLASEAYKESRQICSAAFTKLNRSVVQHAETQAELIQRRALILVGGLGGLVASLIASAFFAYSSLKLTKGYQQQKEAFEEAERQKKALGESEEAFRTLFERSTDPSLIIKDGKFIQCNQAALQLLGIQDVGTIVGRPPEILSPMVQPCGTPSEEKSRRMITRAQVSGFHRFEWVHLKANGTPFEVEVMLTAMKVNGADVIHVIWREITERKDSERRLKSSEERFRSLIKSMQDLVLVLDENNRIQAVHLPTGFHLPGQAGNLLGKGVREIGFPPPVIEKVYEAIYETRQASRPLRVEYALELPGGFVWHDMRLSPYHVTATGACWVTCVVRDITQAKRDEKALESQAVALAAANTKLEKLANHDSLTGLVNRRVFLEEVEAEMRKCKVSHAKAAMLFLDLDSFKAINDTYGHEAGDRILIHTASALSHAIRAGSIGARFGGDEFAILLRSPIEHEEAEAVASRIIQAVQAPITIKGREVGTTCSIGIAYCEGAISLDELVRRADASMYFAKRAGKSRFRSYEPHMADDLTAKTALEADLKLAIRRRQFDLVFQPIFSLNPLVPVELETLLRWENPRLGQVSPAEFIPLAEEMGLINDIGAWIMEEACRRHSSWRAQGLAAGDLRLAVNCSAIQLKNGELPELVADILQSSKMPPRLLTIEVTETAMISGMEPHWDKLEALRLMGVKLAIDDFGAGYSSMGALAQLPLDSVKIDRSFIQSLGSSRESDAILRALVALCGELELDVVAEGIEEPSQLVRSSGLGCHKVQGYLLSRPLSESELHSWMAEASWLRFGSLGEAA